MAAPEGSFPPAEGLGHFQSTGGVRRWAGIRFPLGPLPPSPHRWVLARMPGSVWKGGCSENKSPFGVPLPPESMLSLFMNFSILCL